MKDSLNFVLGLAFVGVALGAGTAYGQGRAPALDAEFETTFTLATGETFATVGRYYRSANGMTREDSPRGSIIVDVKRGTVTLLNPTTKEARVFSIGGPPRPPVPEGRGRPEIFEEVEIKGHRVSKARTKRGEQTDEVWTNQDLGIVVYSKVQGRDVAITKVTRNVVVGEPPHDVFSIPRDYTVIHDSLPAQPPDTTGDAPPPSTRRPLQRPQ